MTRRRIAACAAVVLLLLAPPVAASSPVVIDPAGDATPDRCTLVCTSAVPGESQPAADVLGVDVETIGRDLAVHVSFLDIDHPVPTMGPEEGVIWTDVSFAVFPPNRRRWTSVHFQARRDFAGELSSQSVEVGVGTYGSDDASRLNRTITGSVSLDRVSNRLRFVVSLDGLQRALDEMCAVCGSFGPGSTLESFFARSSATRVISAGVPLAGVGENVALDTGWPRRSHTL